MYSIAVLTRALRNAGFGCSACSESLNAGKADADIEHARAHFIPNE
jgi:hypothetical protein